MRTCTKCRATCLPYALALALATLWGCSRSLTPDIRDISDAGSDSPDGGISDAGAARSGSLDVTFGDGGIVVNRTYTNAYAQAVAVQPDGKVLLAGKADLPDGGRREGSLVVRLEEDGRLDSSFGSDGFALNAPAYRNASFAVALQADGKILAAGNQGGRLPFPVSSSLIRLDPEGRIDTSFANDGVAAREFSSLRALAVLPNSTIVTGGYEILSDSALRTWLLLRYLPDGGPDPDFGNGGVAERAPVADRVEEEITAIAATADQKIVTAGIQTGGLLGHFILRRYTSDGRLDITFGTQGTATGLPFDGMMKASLALQGDGKIIVAGTSGTPPMLNAFVVARYNVDGSVDTSFGSNGVATVEFGDYRTYPTAIAIQPDGKIVAAGYTNALLAQWTLVRYKPNGTLDEDFGNNGVVTTLIGKMDHIYGLALDSRARAVAAGTTDPDGTGRVVISAARYFP